MPLGTGGGRKWGKIANRCKVLGGGDENVLKLDSGDNFTVLKNILKTNELYTSKGWFLCVNYTSIKLLFLKNNTYC